MSEITEKDALGATFGGPAPFTGMPRFFFDTRDSDLLIEDDDGFELTDLHAAKTAASASLAELARDMILPDNGRRVLVVEVRDEQRPVLEVRLTLETIPIVHLASRE